MLGAIPSLRHRTEKNNVLIGVKVNTPKTSLSFLSSIGSLIKGYRIRSGSSWCNSRVSN